MKAGKQAGREGGREKGRRGRKHCHNYKNQSPVAEIHIKSYLS